MDACFDKLDVLNKKMITDKFIFGVAYRQAAIDGTNPAPAGALASLGDCFVALQRPEDAIESSCAINSGVRAGDSVGCAADAGTIQDRAKRMLAVTAASICFPFFLIFCNGIFLPPIVQRDNFSCFFEKCGFHSARCGMLPERA